MTRLLAGSLLLPAALAAGEGSVTVPRFTRDASGLVIGAPAMRSRFFEVVGRRSALFGYEGRARRPGSTR